MNKLTQAMTVLGLQLELVDLPFVVQSAVEEGHSDANILKSFELVGQLGSPEQRRKAQNRILEDVKSPTEDLIDLDKWTIPVLPPCGTKILNTGVSHELIASQPNQKRPRHEVMQSCRFLRDKRAYVVEQTGACFEDGALLKHKMQQAVELKFLEAEAIKPVRSIHDSALYHPVTLDDYETYEKIKKNRREFKKTAAVAIVQMEKMQRKAATEDLKFEEMLLVDALNEEEEQKDELEVLESRVCFFGSRDVLVKDNYCVCGGMFDPEEFMVRCSGDCEGEWYHPECVLQEEAVILETPKQVAWFCPSCTAKGKPEKIAAAALERKKRKKRKQI